MAAASDAAAAPAAAAAASAQAGSDDDVPVGCVLVVDLSAAKGVKDALKAAGLLDRARQAEREEGRVSLPCAPHAPSALPPPPAVAAALASGAARWSTQQLAPRAGAPAPPAACMRAAVAPLLAAAGAPAALLDDLPRRWEKLGDVALLPEACLRDARWEPLHAALWPAVAAALGVRRLARQAAVDPGPRRSSRALLLHPPGATCGWTTVRENGVSYTLDVTQSMFSSGNGTEKARMGAQRAAGETVVDLFAGIGYYTIPLLLHAGAARVHACEWNPPSLEALARNVALNGIADGACVIHAGDCALHAPRRVAHRVLLGLLPSSESGWRAAVEALRDGGGVLHVHATVRNGAQAAWAAGACESFATLAAEAGRRGADGAAWAARTMHIEVVKSYAPRVLHIVADIALGPPSAAANEPPPPLPLPLALGAPLPPPAPLLTLRAPERAALEAAAVARRVPALLTGLSCGAASSLWSASHLAAHPDAAAPVAVHVSATPALEWHARNFAYVTMPLARLVTLAARADAPAADAPAAVADADAASTAVARARAVADAGAAAAADAPSSPPPLQHYYLRAVGRDPRREPASLAASFPGLAAELALPPCCLPAPPAAPHSTVLRVASPGLCLWLHYDVLDNVLLQAVGTKRVLLFPPAAAGGLYLNGSSSALPTRALWPPGDASSADADVAALHAAFPRYAAARAAAHEVTLAPGDALYIPALWAHAVRCEDFSVAVNVFWPPPSSGGGGGARDVYGNVDAPAGAAALAAADAAAAALRRLPRDAAEFYAARVLATVQDAARQQ
jgi:tRNA wybutosine-synthesizing protein 3